ncbi:MAG TPA: hypothetical protein VJ696_13920, partial [Rhodanobacteraceae bacterium]|nr:hypothetical protein [Rhodanobacteraceae bacterium]
MTSAWRIAVGAGCLAACSPFVGMAADFCVNSDAELASVMDAITNAPGEAHRLMLAQGDYWIDFPYVASDGSLSIQGGYDPACDHYVPGAQRTVVHASPQQPYQAYFLAQNGDLSISDITLDGYYAVTIRQETGANELKVSRAAIVLAGSFQNIELLRAGGPAVLENVLVDASSDSCAIDTSRASLDFVTVVNRGTGRGFCSGSTSSIANSIVFSDGGNDIESPAIVTVRYSIFEDYWATLDAASTENLSGPITFQSSVDHLLRDRPDD